MSSSEEYMSFLYSEFPSWKVFYGEKVCKELSLVKHCKVKMFRVTEYKIFYFCVEDLNFRPYAHPSITFIAIHDLLFVNKYS
jgi:hypothetical protein